VIESPFAQLGPQFLIDPYPFYEALRGADPVLWRPDLFGLGAWLVTSHAACSAALRSKQFGKEGNRVLPPEKLANIPQESTEVIERRKGNMLFRDPPDHTRLRGLVNQAFTPRTVEGLRPHIAEIAEHLLSAVQARGHADLIRDFAFPLPIIVIAELLGVSPADRDQFKAWSTDLTQGINLGASMEDLTRTGRAVTALSEYLTQVIEDRRRAPRADLISELVRVQDAGDRLSTDELLGTCRVILTAGHETTVNLISNGTLALLRHPDQLAALAADPSLMENAVEELLRYDSPVQITMRFAMEDAPLGAHTARRGDLVILLLGAANRDPEHFPDPARLDLGRENAHSHLSFGGGIHYCLGASLARLEGELALGALLRRMPKLSLAPGEVTWRSHMVLRGPKALPVTF
jgi:pimeloyl-[acyl-carrier protein] synthase